MHKKKFPIALFTLVPLIGATGIILWATLPKGGPSVSDQERSSSSVSSVAKAPDQDPLPQPDLSTIPGALVGVRMESTVGVVLDELPVTERGRFVAALEAKPDVFWIDRAERQIRLTSLHLSFRDAFYPKGTKKQLPLPPKEQWGIELLGKPAHMNLDGHDVMAVPYRLSATLLTDKDSPGKSEPTLQFIGGVWREPFIFPVDPEFIFQRTGFACMNEAEFPPNSVDAEETDLFYDQNCKVEKILSNLGCHQTQMPDMSCVEASQRKIGKIETTMTFERLPWDAALAAKVRRGTITNPTGPDLIPYHEEFIQHRFTYRYISGNSCTLEEKCVGGPGWRQLLMFPTADLNAGAKPLEIGTVDYFQKMDGTMLSKHGVFELSACHGHYHFSHYGSFTLGSAAEAITRKNGFCLQPTTRLLNNELSPLHHPYVNCIEQGVSPGWIDEYKMGLECQWVDVTDVRKGRKYPLSFETNPDGMLCEGILQLDESGKPMFARTQFKTTDGDPVDRPVCDFYPKWRDNNTDSYEVRVPPVGESYVTEECRAGLFGALRNCGFKNRKTLSECMPGSTVTLRCSVKDGSPVQVVRVCEGSRILQSGIPCTFNEALSTTTVNGSADLTFTCPRAHPGAETGGAYSLLTAPLFPHEERTDVVCEPA